jgi:hypothetical protein
LRLRRFAPWLAAAALALVGCDVTLPKLGRQAAPNTPVLSNAESSEALLGWLESLRLAGPAEQAERIAAAKLAYEQQAAVDGQLRYALALATPGLPGADPALARRHLGELVARGDRLLPGPRTLAQLALAEVDARLTLQSDNLRLQTEGALRDRERTTALTRRLQQELDENNRLRRALDEAQKKLEAVLQLERGSTPVLPSNSALPVPSRPAKRP